jgi:hypothetical protein
MTPAHYFVKIHEAAGKWILAVAVILAYCASAERHLARPLHALAGQQIK